MKDVLISGGDIVIGENGCPELAEGIDLLAQQAEFAAKIPKGSFIYDRELGAFPELPDTGDINCGKKTEALLREAMIKTEGRLEVDSAETVSGVFKIRISLDNGYDNIQREVRVIG